ncbi:MAG: phasin family protein [Acetobacteraceae bacterium]|nr:phasin family protein [Acetobacteraceae bacterium]
MADNFQQTNKPTDQASAAARQAAEAMRQGAQAAQQGGRAAGEALRGAGEMAAEAAQSGSEAGAAAVRRAGEAVGETLRRNAEAFAESQRAFLQTAAQQFEAASRKLADTTPGTVESLRALMALPNTAQGGLQEWQQGMAGLLGGVAQTNLRAAQELFQLANPAALVEVQQRFVRDYLEALLQGTANLVRASRRTAEETLRPLEQQIEQHRRAANQGQAYPHAHAAE